MSGEASILFYIVSVVFMIVCVVLTGVILSQKKRTSGLGTLGSSATAGSQTYWNKNKSRSMEGYLEKYTKVLGCLFFILAIVIGFIQ